MLTIYDQRKGRYSLSARSLLELQAYLKTTYAEDLLECTICLELLTKGVGCPTNACKVWMHAHCHDKYKKRGSKCPSCQADWAAAPEKLVPAGERAARAGDDAQARVRRRGTSEVQDEEEEAEFVEGENDDEDAQTQTQPQTNGRRKSSRRAASTYVFPIKHTGACVLIIL